MQARDEIEFAQEDAETTYFNESHQLAKESVTVVTTLYQGIQADLSEADRGKLQRSMGLKMEQLKVLRTVCSTATVRLSAKRSCVNAYVSLMSWVTCFL